MRTLALLLAILLAATAAAAAAGEPVLVISSSGYYLLVEDTAGVPTLTKFDRVFEFNKPPDTPTDPDPNPTDPVTTHKVAVRAATAAVEDANKANTKTALAKLYRTTGSLPVTSRQQLQDATNTIFNALQLPPAWATWKAAVDRSAASFADIESAKRAWMATADVLEE
jgi:cation transport regulator ChaB